MMLSFTACGTKAEATWQEHYDLGLKYVNEAKYEEAILAFNKALEIDPKPAPVYIALAEVYVRQENYTAAQETLDKAITEIGETEELLAEKENLNDKQTPQNNNISGEGEAPQPSAPASSAEEVPGVVRTERNDDGDGSYRIKGYDSQGYLICKYWYNADGSLGDYNIYVNDISGRVIKETWYALKYGEIHTFEYLYTDGSPVVTMKCSVEAEGETGYTALTHTMANPSNKVSIDGWSFGGDINSFHEEDIDYNWTSFDCENGVITRRD